MFEGDCSRRPLDIFSLFFHFFSQKIERRNHTQEQTKQVLLCSFFLPFVRSFRSSAARSCSKSAYDTPSISTLVQWVISSSCCASAAWGCALWPAMPGQGSFNDSCVLSSFSKLPQLILIHLFWKLALIKVISVPQKLFKIPAIFFFF